MIGWVRLLEENNDLCKFGYSLENNKSCDGILEQNKATGDFFIDRLSAGADKVNSYRICCAIVQSRKAGRFKMELTDWLRADVI